jgi:hypothetical protein
MDTGGETRDRRAGGSRQSCILSHPPSALTYTRLIKGALQGSPWGAAHSPWDVGAPDLRLDSRWGSATRGSTGNASEDLRWLCSHIRPGSPLIQNICWRWLATPRLNRACAAFPDRRAIALSPTVAKSS